MTFLTYDFVCFALLFYLLYFLIPLPAFRLSVIIAASLAFQWHFGGWVSVIPISVLAVTAFLAGRTRDPRAVDATIVLCVATLLFFKYTYFFTDQITGLLAPDVGRYLHQWFSALLPAAMPLGISFFVFEFVHDLVEVRRGGKPISRVDEFLAFAFYWPTMVAGPIKRYQQFLPSLRASVAGPTAADAMIGLCRIAVGFAKKWVADNLTVWIDFTEPNLASMSGGMRWAFLFAISARILLDFSGYSDMAIGFARMMGIVVPENFRWPYMARSPIEFWQRWHISLSSWIRDYIYIPLGGNRLGKPRRLVNVGIAMALCGLWHGPSWHFAVWGLYHGAGLAIAALLQNWLQRGGAQIAATSAVLDSPIERAVHAYRIGLLRCLLEVIAWAATMLFVAFGWLLFFYPLDKGWHIFRLLVWL